MRRYLQLATGSASGVIDNTTSTSESIQTSMTRSSQTSSQNRKLQFQRQQISTRQMQLHTNKQPSSKASAAKLSQSTVAQQQSKTGSDRHNNRQSANANLSNSNSATNPADGSQQSTISASHKRNGATSTSEQKGAVLSQPEFQPPHTSNKRDKKLKTSMPNTTKINDYFVPTRTMRSPATQSRDQNKQTAFTPKQANGQTNSKILNHAKLASLSKISQIRNARKQQKQPVPIEETKNSVVAISSGEDESQQEQSCSGGELQNSQEDDSDQDEDSAYDAAEDKLLQQQQMVQEKSLKVNDELDVADLDKINKNKDALSSDSLSPKHLVEQQQVTYFQCIKNDINRQVHDTLDNWSSQQPIAAHFKLSFFNKEKPVYAIPRIPCGLESTADTALKLVRKESIELQRYMRDVYHVDDKICPETQTIKFPCKDRWLKGEEYGFLIRHYFAYSRVLNLHILSEKYHPNIVYERPEDGTLYFIRGLHLQDFGFPRVKIQTNAEVSPIGGKSGKSSQSKNQNGDCVISENNTIVQAGSQSGGNLTQMSKLYKWKKINYKTFLPKHAPVVVYIVAKANTFDRSLLHNHGAGGSESNNGPTRRTQGGQPSSSQGLPAPLGPQTHFMMHAAAHSSEFDRRYTQSDVSRQLRCQGTRLMTEDRQAGPEVQRVIVCHIKQKLIDAAKRNKRNKPCRQFRKQSNNNNNNNPSQSSSQNTNNVPKVFDINRKNQGAINGKVETGAAASSSVPGESVFPQLQLQQSEEVSGEIIEDNNKSSRPQKLDVDFNDNEPEENVDMIEEEHVLQKQQHHQQDCVALINNEFESVERVQQEIVEVNSTTINNVQTTLGAVPVEIATAADQTDMIQAATADRGDNPLAFIQPISSQQPLNNAHQGDYPHNARTQQQQQQLLDVSDNGNQVPSKVNNDDDFGGQMVMMQSETIIEPTKSELQIKTTPIMASTATVGAGQKQSAFPSMMQQDPATFNNNSNINGSRHQKLLQLQHEIQQELNNTPSNANNNIAIGSPPALFPNLSADQLHQQSPFQQSLAPPVLNAQLQSQISPLVLQHQNQLAAAVGGSSALGIRSIAPTENASQLLAETLSAAANAVHTNNADCHSELSGFDEDMLSTEEMNEILESRNKCLVDHMLLLSNDKLTKWTKEMNRQLFNKSQQQQLQQQQQLSLQNQAAASSTSSAPQRANQLVANNLAAQQQQQQLLVDQQQQNVCKYAFFMAKWKHKIYKKFVMSLQNKEQTLLKGGPLVVPQQGFVDLPQASLPPPHHLSSQQQVQQMQQQLTTRAQQQSQPIGQPTQAPLFIPSGPLGASLKQQPWIMVPPPPQQQQTPSSIVANETGKIQHHQQLARGMFQPVIMSSTTQPALNSTNNPLTTMSNFNYPQPSTAFFDHQKQQMMPIMPNERQMGGEELVDQSSELFQASVAENQQVFQRRRQRKAFEKFLAQTNYAAAVGSSPPHQVTGRQFSQQQDSQNNAAAAAARTTFQGQNGNYLYENGSSSQNNQQNQQQQQLQVLKQENYHHQSISSQQPQNYAYRNSSRNDDGRNQLQPVNHNIATALPMGVQNTSSNLAAVPQMIEVDENDTEGGQNITQSNLRTSQQQLKARQTPERYFNVIREENHHQRQVDSQEEQMLVIESENGGNTAGQAMLMDGPGENQPLEQEVEGQEDIEVGDKQSQLHQVIEQDDVVDADDQQELFPKVDDAEALSNRAD